MSKLTDFRTVSTKDYFIHFCMINRTQGTQYITINTIEAKYMYDNEGAVAVSVEALVFIVIGRSCSEGCGFDSHYRSGSFLRFNYRSIMSSPYCAT